MILAANGIAHTLASPFLLRWKLGLQTVHFLDHRHVVALLQIAGEIKDFDPGDLVDKKSARRLDLVIKYILVAGKKV